MKNKNGKRSEQLQWTYDLNNRNTFAAIGRLDNGECLNQNSPAKRD